MNQAGPQGSRRLVTEIRREDDTSNHLARLYWIPLGSGQRVVRISGRTFEAVSAALQHRQRRALYHAALVVNDGSAPVSIEVAPIPDANGVSRGVVGEGPVGMRWLGRFRLFRYEVRRWPNGVIPDLPDAVDQIGLDVDQAQAQHILDLMPSIPTPVWGRDELGAGEMWNSNSVVSWLLTRSEVDVDSIDLPEGGRAPGWDAGRTVARRST